MEYLQEQLSSDLVVLWGLRAWPLGSTTCPYQLISYSQSSPLALQAQNCWHLEAGKGQLRRGSLAKKPRSQSSAEEILDAGPRELKKDAEVGLFTLTKNGKML